MHYKDYKTILSQKNGMNIYRGCTHGCIYCDSRSSCYHIDHQFEDIEVKENAPAMLENELRKKKCPIMVATGSMTDPYNHTDDKLQYTRQCLQVIEKYNCGISVLTKSAKVLNDMDLYKSINHNSKAIIQMTLTTYDDELCKILEPNVSVTSERVSALKYFNEEGIKTIVWLSPILPWINDTEENLIGLLDYCSEANVYGIIFFGFGLTLREGNREYFYSKLDQHFPGLREKYEKTFGQMYQCASPNNDKLTQLLINECKKRNIILDNDRLFQYMAEYPKKNEQISLF